MPRRPPGPWFHSCETAVQEHGGAVDAGAVCGAEWQKKSPTEKRAQLRAEGDRSMHAKKHHAKKHAKKHHPKKHAKKHHAKKRAAKKKKPVHHARFRVTRGAGGKTKVEIVR